MSEEEKVPLVDNPSAETVNVESRQLAGKRRNFNLGRLFLGLAVIMVGLFYLGRELGWIPDTLHFDWNIIWPLLVIFLGISLITIRTVWGLALGALAIVAILGLAAASFVLRVGPAGSDRGVIINEERTSGPTNEAIDIAKREGVTRAEISIRAAAGQLNMGGGSEKLLTGSFWSDFFELTQKDDVQNGMQMVALEQDGNWRGIPRGGSRMELQLNSDLPLAIKLDTGAMGHELDFSGLLLESLEIRTGASDLNLSLGDKAQNLSVKVDAGASSVSITLPTDAGVRIDADTGLSSRDIDPRLKRLEGNAYQTDSYATAAKKISLDLNLGASNLNVRFR